MTLSDCIDGSLVAGRPGHHLRGLLNTGPAGPCGVSMWCVHVVCPRGVFTWCVHVVCRRGVFKWCVHMVCPCGVSLWCVLVAFPWIHVLCVVYTVHVVCP